MSPELLWIFLLLTAALVLGILYLIVRRRRFGAMGPYDGAPIKPTELVSVKMRCAGDDFSLVVSPWTAYVKNGRPLRWILDGASGDLLRIEAKDAQRWPFPALPPQVPVEPGRPFEAGKVSGTKGQAYGYSIVLQCGSRTFNIDPDIFIWE